MDCWPTLDWSHDDVDRLSLYLDDTDITHLAIDTETEGVYFLDRAFCVSMAWRDKGELCSCYIELEHDPVGAGQRAASLLALRAGTWVFHNSKFDLQKLILAGVVNRSEVSAGRFEDTEGLYYIHDMHGRKALKYLARTLLDIQTDEEEELSKVRRKLKKKKADGYTVLPREVIIPYAIKDAEYTLLLYEYLMENIAYDEDDLAVYAREKRVTCTLLDMEAAGIGVDYRGLRKIYKEYNGRLLKLATTLTNMMSSSGWVPTNKKGVEVEVNFNSNQQLMEYMDEVHNIKLPNAQAETFEQHEDNQFVATLLEYKHVSKMLSTYLNPLIKEGKEGVYHPWFNQYRASTGRFTSSSASNE
jgi:DNA polymerase I-like protein with 3'-5' exonuclease and polymerase domains